MYLFNIGGLSTAESCKDVQLGIICAFSCVLVLAVAQVCKQRIAVSMLPVCIAEPNPTGAAIAAFANNGPFKVLVVGSRGMGAFKRCAGF